MIKHVIWSSMIDYPGHTCTVMFTGNCNFNCDYCYNKTLKEQENKKFEDEILPKLIERKDFINHIIISGGEPTVDPDFEKIIDILHKQGFVIGVHTNGSNPDIIINNIDKIDYFGIDIKTSFNKYNEAAGIHVNVDNVKKTIEYIIKSGKQYELRTTLFPRDVTKQDVVEIANWLKDIGANKYCLQQFYPVNGAKVVKQYTIEQLNEIKEASNCIINTVLKTK